MSKVLGTINKYCEVHAETEIKQLADFPAERIFKHVIVIPAYNENPDFLVRMRDLATQNAGTLLILIINQPDCDIHNPANTALHNRARLSGAPIWTSTQLRLLDWGNDSALLLVDRFTAARCIPRKQGVGLARKIGCDLAVALWRQGSLTASFIHNTDADASLPSDYLRQTRDMQGVSAALYPFRHWAADDDLGRATKLYEKSLHYYVDGLKWAGSPYSFHTVGSCIAISLRHYCLVRGFPKRAGGEDFYLLNKLAKLAPVKSTSGSVIELQARESSRVPFGTGPAVAKILALGSSDQFSTYDPRVFVELNGLLKHFRRLSAQQDKRDEQPNGAWLSSLPASARNACLALNIDELLFHLAKQGDTDAQLQRHAHDWFDAFRTLKFIHYLQEHYYPPVMLSEALSHAEQLFG